MSYLDKQKEMFSLSGIGSSVLLLRFDLWPMTKWSLALIKPVFSVQADYYCQ